MSLPRLTRSNTRPCGQSQVAFRNKLGAPRRRAHLAVCIGGKLEGIRDGWIEVHARRRE